MVLGQRRADLGASRPRPSTRRIQTCYFMETGFLLRQFAQSVDNVPAF